MIELDGDEISSYGIDGGFRGARAFAESEFEAYGDESVRVHVEYREAVGGVWKKQHTFGTDSSGR